jgi:hypothetical protein
MKIRLQTDDATTSAANTTKDRNDRNGFMNKSK